MATVGEAIIKLVYDGKSASASLTATKKDAEAKLNELQKNVVKKGAKIATLATAGVATAITGLATKSVKAFAEFEQISGGIQKIFDEMDYSTIEKDANQAWKSMNISASEYMKQISGVGAIFAQTMGDKKGYESAKTGMQAIADYASGTGASVETLMEKFQMISRATTSYQSIADQFAGILPQTTKDFLKQAQSAGFLSEKYKKLNDVPVAEYQEAISKMLQKGVGDMGLLGNTSEETEKTISGSFNAMKSSWENVVTNFVNGGDNLDEALDALSDNIVNLARNVIPKFFQAFANIYGKIFERAPVVTAFVTALAGVATAITAINLATKLWTASTLALEAVMKLSSVTILGHPIFLVAGVIAGIIAVLVLLVTHINEVGQFFQQLGVIIQTTLGDFSAKALEVINGFTNGFRNAITRVKEWFSTIPAFFAGVFGKITGLFKNIGTKIGEVVSGAFKAVVNGVISFIEGFLNTPINAVNGLIDTINKVPNINVPRLDTINLPRLAKGGVATGSTLANIGEAGDEAVIPLERDVERWAVPMAKALAEQFGEQSSGSGITVYMTNNINNNLDADEIGRRLMTSIRRAV